MGLQAASTAARFWETRVMEHSCFDFLRAFCQATTWIPRELWHMFWKKEMVWTCPFKLSSSDVGSCQDLNVLVLLVFWFHAALWNSDAVSIHVFRMQSMSCMTRRVSGHEPCIVIQLNKWYPVDTTTLCDEQQKKLPPVLSPRASAVGQKSVYCQLHGVRVCGVRVCETKVLCIVNFMGWESVRQMFCVLSTSWDESLQGESLWGKRHVHCQLHGVRVC